MTFRSYGCISALLALATGVSSAGAFTIGIRFTDEDTGFGNAAIGSSVVGAPGYAQANWNTVAVHDRNASSSNS